MHDDIFEEDLFEEDLFEEEPPPPSDEIDDDTQYVLDLMQQSIDLCEEAESLVNRLLEINNIYGDDVTGISKDILEQIRFVFDKMIPDLTTGEMDSTLIKATAMTLDVSEETAQSFVDEKRAKLLERLDKNNNK